LNVIGSIVYGNILMDTEFVMFNASTSPQQSRHPALELRGSLLGNEDLSKVALYAKDGEDSPPPWSHFAAAANALPHNRKRAFQNLVQIVKTPDMPSRVYLQAWHSLRALGQSTPPSLERQVGGIIIEVGFNDGFDLLAGYADHTARYFNHAGGAVIWDSPHPKVDENIDLLLKVTQEIVKHTTPVVVGEKHPDPPTSGHVLISMLTYGGNHFGHGKLEDMQKAKISAPLMALGTELLQSLITLSKKD
jgi:hypothetical protein